MTVTAAGSGTQTATVTTEHTLLDISAAGSYVLEVDCINLVAGDAVEFRLYAIILTGGTRRVVYFERRSGPQPTDDMIAVSVPISNELTDSGSIRATLKQTQGTSRNFPWKVLQL